MALRIIVCAKQVPDNDKVKIDFKTGNLIRSSVKGVLNKDDLNALSQALLIKEKYEDTVITVVSMGPPEASDILFEALARGADKGILLSDKSFAGADTWATSNVIAAAIRKIGDFDLIFTGKQASDGDTAMVGPQLAEKLSIPHLSYIKSFELGKDMKTVRSTRDLDDGTYDTEISLPALFTCSADLNVPEYIKMKGIFAEKNISVWDAKDLELDLSQIGISGSKTLVLGTYPIAPKTPGFIVEGDTEGDKVGSIIDILKGKKYL